jgi:hypothetical protein
VFAAIYGVPVSARFERATLNSRRPPPPATGRAMDGGGFPAAVLDSRLVPD